MRSVWYLSLLTILTAQVLAAEDKPQPVSPGDGGVATRTATSCPTYSWGTVEGAVGYQLALYRLTRGGALELERQMELAGNVGSWTPSLDRCPASGSDNAWAVRAVTDTGPGPWSQMMLFTVPGIPSDDDLRRAVETIQRYRGSETAEVRGGRSVRDGRVAVPQALATDSVAATPAATVTPPAGYSLSLENDMHLGRAVFQDGSPLMHTYGGASYGNTALGLNALESVTPGSPGPAFGSDNSAFGRSALEANTSGSANTATGYRALLSNTTGFRNTADGFKALFSNNTGSRNTAAGYRALFYNTSGSHNTAVGFHALFNNESGAYNTAVGSQALLNNTGTGNTAVGPLAGYAWTGGMYNIAVGKGAYGQSGESGTIRIGGQNKQTQTFIEGINAYDATGGKFVCIIGSSDRLGHCGDSTLNLSSRRFKRDVRTLDSEWERLASLRPVSFRYLPGITGEPAPRVRYGFVAEEVVRVFPHLVGYDPTGRPERVHYGLLTPLLLRELQRQDQEIAALRREVVRLARARGR